MYNSLLPIGMLGGGGLLAYSGVNMLPVIAVAALLLLLGGAMLATAAWRR